MKTWTIKLIVGGCFILALVVTVTSFFCNDDFWKVNAAQALTLILTICIAFWATQLKNDVRKKKEHAEQILKKIQVLFVDIVNKNLKDEVLPFDEERCLKEIKDQCTKFTKKSTTEVLVEDYFDVNDQSDLEAAQEERERQEEQATSRYQHS